MIAATRQSLPTVLHEQNAILGRANRLLAQRVGTIATSFASVGAMRVGARARIIETGNPVRPEIAALRDASYATPMADGLLRILILGGSQGARILSAVVPAALATLPDTLRRRLVVMQQARSEDLAEVKRAHAASGIAAECAAFFDDVPRRLSEAQLVISRAGASTVAEIETIGRPAIFVPYRYAADDHQTANAAALAEAGAAQVMAETEFTPERLAAAIAALVADPTRLAAMAASAHRLGRPDAARHLANIVVAAAGGGNGTREHAA
jgi:UDP-N-acetylglucosamine--N-acetylmuramyl-(pentapeptide) pyrophosphoryl-undecaprenol N-acetylglucosamine transferase